MTKTITADFNKAANGHNQTDVRDGNLKLFFNELIRGDSSRVDIAKKYNISKTASSKIVAELLNLNLIKETAFQKKRVAPGIRPTFYTINNDLGVIAILDMSSVETVISVCSLSGKVLAEIRVPNMEKIKHGDILHFADCLQDLLSRTEFAGKRLLRICIALPCAINKITNKVFWSPRFSLTEDLDLQALFSQRFGAKVIIANDVQLLLCGEVHSDAIGENVKYALMAYIDSGIGGAFYMDGRLEDGYFGFGGDIGYYAATSEGGAKSTLDDEASINGIKNAIKAKIVQGAASSLSGKVGGLRFKDVLAAYREGDALTMQCVHRSAQEAAEAIKGIVRILNIPLVVISGRITKFGGRYLEIIEQALSSDMFFDADVKYASLSDGINKGALVTALDRILDEIVFLRK